MMTWSPAEVVVVVVVVVVAWVVVAAGHLRKMAQRARQASPVQPGGEPTNKRSSNSISL